MVIIAGSPARSVSVETSAIDEPSRAQENAAAPLAISSEARPTSTTVLDFSGMLAELVSTRIEHPVSDRNCDNILHYRCPI